MRAILLEVPIYFIGTYNHIVLTHQYRLIFDRDCSVDQRVRSPVEATFLSGVFSPLTSAEVCEKSSRVLQKVSLGLR